MKIVSIDEMEECLNAACYEHALVKDREIVMARWSQTRQLAEAACEAYGRLIADVFDLEFVGASMELGFGGLCSTLALKTTDQELHPALEELDPDGEWETSDRKPHASIEQ